MKTVLLIATFEEGAYAHVINKVLKDEGYLVYMFDHRKFVLSYGKVEADKYLKGLYKNIELDYILSIKGRELFPSTIESLNGEKILWWFDSAIRYSDFEEHAAVYDKCWVVEEGQGYPWMPIVIDLDIHHPIQTDDPAFKSDCTFIGTGHPKRIMKVIKMTHNLPYDIKIWGNDWYEGTPNHVGKAIYWDNLMKAYAGSKIILNAHYIPGITPNMRAIEAPASGTMVLSDTGPGLEQCFKKGTEYVPYNTIKEARQMIRKYMEEPEEREKIGLAGYKRVIKDHLLKYRIEEMFK